MKKVMTEGCELIQKSLIALENKDYATAKQQILEAQEIFKKQKAGKYMSICLSLIGMLDYLEDKSNYKSALGLLQDSCYMAELDGDITSKIFYEISMGNINYCENNTDVALLHFQNAKNYGIKKDEFNLLGFILTRIKQLQSGLEFNLPIQSDPLVSLVKIGRSINALTDITELLKVIAEETKIAMQADRCTVFFFF